MSCCTALQPTACRLQLQVLEAPLEKKAGINYGPPGTKHLVYFVDDLNMPKLDPYETAMPISLIRQHLAWGHWFGELPPCSLRHSPYQMTMPAGAGCADKLLFAVQIARSSRPRTSTTHSTLLA